MPRSYRLLLYVHHLRNIVSFCPIFSKTKKIQSMQNTNQINQIQQIKVILKKYNITQKELAQEMKVEKTSINKYFVGKRNLTHKIFLRIMGGLWAIANKRAQDWQSLYVALSQIKT